jgi:hypothetical protein
MGGRSRPHLRGGVSGQASLGRTIRVLLRAELTLPLGLSPGLAQAVPAPDLSSPGALPWVLYLPILGRGIPSGDPSSRAPDP